MESPELRRRLANAKRRARFWSGVPSFSRHVAKSRNVGERDTRYEIAMCDVRSLTALLEERTGRKLVLYDPQAQWRETWNAINSALVRGAPVAARDIP